MANIEKVIRGLECCTNYGRDKYDDPPCKKCPYTHDSTYEQCCNDNLHKDALELLKKQEPRVMTLEEVKRHNNQDGCVWFEQPTYNAVAAFARKDDEDYTEIISPYLLGDPINHCYMENRFYGNAWRCWTSRPTDEQRQAVKWNERPV